MKRIIIVSLVLTIAAIVIGIIASISEEKEPEPLPVPEIDELIPEGARADRDMNVTVLIGEETVTMAMEKYLIGVIASEMPGSFEEEALKAQAVAARTDTMYNMYIARKPRHPDADVCSDHTCCMAYSGDETLRTRWGNDYLTYIMKIIHAVIETDGVYITYDNEPILAVFHSSSAGRTENSGNVWLVDLPYLVSVPSPETDDQVPNYTSSVIVTQKDFRAVIQEAYPDAELSTEPELWITEITRTISGRIDTVNIGGQVISGTKLRALFTLRSTAANIEIVDGDIVFTTTGYGHGVGMSQYGANIMAKQGKTYREIIHAYYTGVTLTDGGSTVVL